MRPFRCAFRVANMTLAAATLDSQGIAQHRPINSRKRGKLRVVVYTFFPLRLLYLLPLIVL